MVKIKKHTEGDSRVSKELPTFIKFRNANLDHIDDVQMLSKEFAEELRDRISSHDWTKKEEKYESMFYRDLCDTIQGRMNFEDGEWSKLHYELERHHLNRRVPKDVDLFDVIEMLCDCVAAGMARSGEVRPVVINQEILSLAVDNTVEWLKNRIEVE